MIPTARLAAKLQIESMPITLFGAYVVSLFVRLPDALGQDGWLALVTGREIAHGGIPRVDSLAAWSSGSNWIDQQWLAQLLLYRVSTVGGVRLVMLVHVVLLAAALALALVAARRRGGSARAVALVAAPALVTILMAAQMRTQSFAYVLFVGVLWLLLEDQRRSRRLTSLVFPLLVLWANLHGSVVLGAALVSVYGLLHLNRSRGRAVAFVVLAPACVFVSPYGLSLIGYYHHTAFNSEFANVVVEWGRATPSLLTLPFYALAGTALWLVLRYRPFTTLFEQVALALLFVAGVLALRNIVWFSYAAIVLLPVLLQRRLSSDREAASPRFRTAIAAAAVAAMCVAGVAAAARSPSWYQARSFPPDAAAAVAKAAREKPQLGIYADVRFADWLLWHAPRLAGRIAYDARLELLSAEQLQRIYEARNGSTAAWSSVVGNSGIVVVRASDRTALAAISRERARRLYADSRVVVFLRSARPA